MTEQASEPEWPVYDPADWYWDVEGVSDQWWSSAAGGYVDALPEGAGVSRIASEAELVEVLAAYGLTGPMDLSTARARYRADLMAALADIEQQIIGGYTEGERASWDRKRTEADLIHAGATDPAHFPLIAAETAISGADPATIADVIRAKAAGFERVAGLISGTRQKGEAQIAAAGTVEGVQAVVPAVMAGLMTALSA